MANKIKLVYVAHPYGGKPENAKAVQKIIESLTSGDHPLVADKTPNDNIPVFDMPSIIVGVPVEDLLHAVYVSPIHQQGFMYEGTPYLTGLQKCLQLLRRCDILLLCGDWQQSKGCMAEFAHAMNLGINIIFENANDYYDLI